MNQTVDAAEIDEHTEVGDRLDDAFENKTLFELGENLLALACEVLLKQHLVRDDHVLVRMIDFDNANIKFAIDKRIEVAHRAHIDLRTGKECLHAEKIDDETTLDTANDLGLEHILCLVRLDNPLPDTHEVCTLAAEDQLAIRILYLLEIHLDLVARLQVFDIIELVARKDSLRLEADIDRDFIVGDLNNPALDDLMLCDLAERSFIHLR